MKIRKLLVANRGEIACRVLRTARELDLETVTIHTEADRGAPHTLGETVEVGSYLSIEEVMKAARDRGADALHPGYGFLAENPELVQACQEAGVVFLGPSVAAMRALGDKATARARATELGIPVADGEGPFEEPAEVAEAARRLGTPVMLKAAAGGGGKGMKCLTSFDRLDDEIASSQRESEAAFGDRKLIVERYIHPARHVEVQILGDGKDAVALGERECSLQRRHQKIIEESPSVAVDEGLRARLQESACELARAVEYGGAGTVEFLLGPDGSYYFLEVNARLQVEHPVTELRTGLDLVGWQIEIAQGGRLPAAESLRFAGHAIEARLCAEDPWMGFLPSAGKLLRVVWPSGVRVDSGLGERVTTHYDSLIAKIISHGSNREEARHRLIAALRQTAVLGVMTNQEYLIALLESDAFVSGETFTSTVDRWSPERPPLPEVLATAAALELRRPPRRGVEVSPWDRLGEWRLS